MSTEINAVAPLAAAGAEEGPRFSRRVTLLTMLSVLLVMLLASLDQTIVGTALPKATADLPGFTFGGYTWVTTAYLLTSTVMVPIYGKLSDIFGRKPIMIFALSLFLLGSGLSGASHSFDQLILFRAFQGLGAGGLMSIAIAIVGDLFTPRERARWQGVTGSILGVAFIIGPTIGGWITDSLNWRWVFYVNLPLGVIALLTLIFLMPTLRHPQKGVKIDFIGAALLVVGAVPLLLGLSWGGSQYDWNSPQVLGALAVALVGSVAFVLYELRLERQGGQPIFEPTLFKNNAFAISIIVTMFAGVALFGSIYYIPLFVQGVVGTSATNSGVIITPLMMAAVVTSIFSGQLVARSGRYKWIALAGAGISIVGTLLLLRLGVHSTNSDVVVAMVVLGLGMGAGMSLYTLIVQNALPTKIGQASAGITFFRQIGSTIGLAAMGAVMNATYPSAFRDALPAQVKQALPAQALKNFDNPQVLLSSTAMAKLHDAFAQFGPQGTALLNAILDGMKTGITQGVHSIFLMGLGLSIASVIVLFFLKEIPLRGGGTRRPSVVAEAEEALADEAGVALPAGHI